MYPLITVFIIVILLGCDFPSSASALEGEVPHETSSEEIESASDEQEPLPVGSDEAIVPAKTEVGESGEDESDGEGEQESEEEPVIDVAHKKISSGVLATARWLDSFFADPRIEDEISETRVKVRFSVFAEEGDDVEYNVRANLRLDLPILKERFQLLIAGDPEEDEEAFRAISGRQGERPDLISRDDDVSASLRYFLVDTLQRNISLRSGIRWRDSMPTLFLEPRYRRTVPLDSWLFRFTQRVIGYTDGRTGIRTSFDLERKLTEKFFFRSSADGEWASDEDGYFYSAGVSLFQSFSARRVMIYGLGASFQTRPHNRLEEIALSVRYRQRILRDWLFYEIIPQVSFPREERDFEATPGILLRLEMLFGHYPILPAPK